MALIRILLCLLLLLFNIFSRVLTTIEVEDPVQDNSDKDEAKNELPELQMTNQNQKEIEEGSDDFLKYDQDDELLQDLFADDIDEVSQKDSLFELNQFPQLQFKYMKSFYKALKDEKNKSRKEMNVQKQLTKNMAQQNEDKGLLQQTIQRLKIKLQKIVMQQKLLRTQMQIFQMQSKFLTQMYWLNEEEQRQKQQSKKQKQNNAAQQQYKQNYNKNNAQQTGQKQQSNQSPQTGQTLSPVEQPQQKNSTTANINIENNQDRMMVGCLQDVDCLEKDTVCRNSICIDKKYTIQPKE